jgi:predicted dehydrogenase
MMKKLRIGLIGYKFMGRAHSNAWKKAPLFFDLDSEPILQVVCGRNEGAVKEFAEKWGWKEVETDWKKVIARDDIDIIDIALPQHLHYEIAIEAAMKGKHIFCEKPMAMNSIQAEEMLKVCEENKVIHYLNHNYRRVPAIALAKQIIDEGRIGRIYHWRSAYQQDWITDPSFPLTWQLKKELAQAGPQWDLNSHCVDLSLYLIGKIISVSAMTVNFITERPLAEERGSGNLKAEATGEGTGTVSVEDAALMHVKFANGAIGSFEATRFANGRKNKLSFEIYGSKGSLAFDLERMNELQFYDEDDPTDYKGFKKILVTEDTHPYVGHWWPAGHIIGYEHTFVHAVADFINNLTSKKTIEPNFSTGTEVIKILEAGIKAEKEKREIIINTNN